MKPSEAATHGRRARLGPDQAGGKAERLQLRQQGFGRCAGEQDGRGVLLGMDRGHDGHVEIERAGRFHRGGDVALAGG